MSTFLTDFFKKNLEQLFFIKTIELQYINRQLIYFFLATSNPSLIGIKTFSTLSSVSIVLASATST